MKIVNFTFSYICQILPETDPSGKVIEFLPQSRYENKRAIKLHKYGNGPFCKFTINRNFSKKTGVYVMKTKDTFQYVGECDDFFKRFGMGYGNISPRNCFEGGQPTNCRINSKILSSIKSGNPVSLYFFETDERFRVEHELIVSLNPPWNKTSGKPSKI